MLASPPDWLCAIFGFSSPPDCLQAKMVLPVRIELTTSALPRMRSTTELRQHFSRKARLWLGTPRPSTRLDWPPSQRHLRAMTGKDKDREDRLAAALRENLRRRKAQARASADPQSEEAPKPEA